MRFESSVILYGSKNFQDRILVLTPKTENRLFLWMKDIEQGLSLDENESFYIGKVDSLIEVESVGTESDYISVSAGER